MSSLLQNDNSLEAVDKTAIANHDTVPGVSQKAAESGPSVQRDLIPISGLSLEDDLDCAQDKDAIKGRSYDELAKRGKENGTAGGSHKYSTRRNLSNMSAALRNEDISLQLTYSAGDQVSRELRLRQKGFEKR